MQFFPMALGIHGIFADDGYRQFPTQITQSVQSIFDLI